MCEHKRLWPSLWILLLVVSTARCTSLVPGLFLDSILIEDSEAGEWEGDVLLESPFPHPSPPFPTLPLSKGHSSPLLSSSRIYAPATHPKTCLPSRGLKKQTKIAESFWGAQRHKSLPESDTVLLWVLKKVVLRHSTRSCLCSGTWSENHDFEVRWPHLHTRNH